MGQRVVDLADHRARDAALAGAKAAGLAKASAAGLPVLPGVVVPVCESAEVVREATQALDAEDTEVAARRAVMVVEPDPQLVSELRVRLAEFPAPLIVRSSSPLEADGTWSGAFSSFQGITLDDLSAAVRGCWGSAFAVPVLDRARQTGTSAHQLGLAVLVQPELHPDLGGTARLRRDGSVLINSTRGPLLPLMEGNVDGWVSEVDAEDRVVATGGDVQASTVQQVAGLARQVHSVLEHRLIEWAVVDDRVYLLQSLRSEDPVSKRGDVHSTDPALASAVAVRVARLAQGFPGRLGHDLVLPWAVAFGGDLPEPAPSGLEPAAALAAAQREASSLVTEVWGGYAPHEEEAAVHVLQGLRGDRAAEALEVLERLPRPSRDRAAALLGHLEAVRSGLPAEAGVHLDARFWRLSPTSLEEALTAGEVPTSTRLGADQWEPFVHRVVTARGTSYGGSPVVAGAGAGRVHVVGDIVPEQSPDGRYVIVTGRPLPGLAPMLWNAAGLVTRAHSTAAHLIEFAHSLGVPTVVGCELPMEELSRADLVSVDGERGSVSLLGGGSVEAQ